MTDIKITLKAARVNAGLTIKQAAEKLGVAYGTLIRWEQHPEKVSAIRQKEISDAYNVDIDNIIFLPLK